MKTNILCMGRAQIGSGPCKEYVSYMYLHIILYDRRLFDIVLYHPTPCLGSDPILFSSGNLWGSPEATNMGLPKEKSMGLPREKSMGLPQTLKSDFLWGYPRLKIWVLGGGMRGFPCGGTDALHEFPACCFPVLCRVGCSIH